MTRSVVEQRCDEDGDYILTLQWLDVSSHGPAHDAFTVKDCNANETSFLLTEIPEIREALRVFHENVLLEQAQEQSSAPLPTPKPVVVALVPGYVPGVTEVLRGERFLGAYFASSDNPGTLYVRATATPAEGEAWVQTSDEAVDWLLAQNAVTS